MKIAIFDACFPEKKQKSVGLAAMWLRHEATRLGIEIVDHQKADAILVTCVSTSQRNYVSNLSKVGPPVIVGGAASTSPMAFLQSGAYAVCVGDGQSTMQAMSTGMVHNIESLQNVLIEGKNSVSVDSGFCWEAPPIQGEDGAYRVWAGRGCKNKCLFCQTGWAMEYSENPNPDNVINTARKLIKSGKKVAYLTNDLNQHSFAHQLPATTHGSYSIRYIKKYGLPPSRQIRLGVEGVSERLRAMVNKPISNRDLVDMSAWLVKNKKSVRWFMIAGLPGETNNDWEELRECVQRFKRITQKGVLALSFTAWCPDPATPLATQPLDDMYWHRWESFREWFFGGKGWSNRVKIMQPQQPKSRLIKAMDSMCLDANSLKTGGYWGPNDVVAYPYKTTAKNISCRLTIYREDDQK